MRTTPVRHFRNHGNGRYEEKNIHRRKVGGLKATIAVASLRAVVNAAKKHCAMCRVQETAITKEGEVLEKCLRCKLKTHIEIADKIAVKYEKRNDQFFKQWVRQTESQDDGEGDGGEPEFNPPPNMEDRPTRW